MTDDLIYEFVWEQAGFGFTGDGIYLVDFGINKQIAEWDETHTTYSDLPAKYQ